MARGDGLGCSARVEKGRERLGCFLEAIGKWVVDEMEKVGDVCASESSKQMDDDKLLIFEVR